MKERCTQGFSTRTLESSRPGQPSLSGGVRNERSRGDLHSPPIALALVVAGTQFPSLLWLAGWLASTRKGKQALGHPVPVVSALVEEMY